MNGGNINRRRRSMPPEDGPGSSSGTPAGGASDASPESFSIDAYQADGTPREDVARRPLPTWGVAGAAGTAVGVSMVGLGVLDMFGWMDLGIDSPLGPGILLLMISGAMLWTAVVQRREIEEAEREARARAWKAGRAEREAQSARDAAIEARRQALVARRARDDDAAADHGRDGGPHRPPE